MSKRGQYFTIDAFIALIVIFTGLLLVLSATSYTPSLRQPEELSKIIDSFVEKKINTINHEFLREKIRDGNITNPHNTIMQQAHEFYLKCTPPRPFPDPADCDDVRFTGETPQEELMTEVAADIIPLQYGFQVLIDGNSIYERNTSLKKDQKNTDLLVSGKRIVFGTDENKNFWGPVDVEVRVWQ